MRLKKLCITTLAFLSLISLASCNKNKKTKTTTTPITTTKENITTTAPTTTKKDDVVLLDGNFKYVFKYTYNSSTEIRSHRLDENSSYVDYYKRVILYDNENREIEKTTYTYSPSENMLYPNLKFVTSYPSENKRIETTYHTYLIDEDDWLGGYKNEETLITINGKKKVSSFIQSTKKTTGFVVSYKLDYDYDEAGKLKQSIEYKKSGDSWIENEKIDYSYDTFGNYDRETIVYSSFSDDWDYHYKEVNYSKNGVLYIEEVYEYETTDFVLSEKYEHSYDENGYETSIVYSELGNDNLFAVKNKYEYYYDDNGRILAEIDYSAKQYEQDGEVVVEYTPLTKETYFTDAYEYNLTDEYYDWDSEAQDWVIS